MATVTKPQFVMGFGKWYGPAGRAPTAPRHRACLCRLSVCRAKEAFGPNCWAPTRPVTVGRYCGDDMLGRTYKPVMLQYAGIAAPACRIRQSFLKIRVISGADHGTPYSELK